MTLDDATAAKASRALVAAVLSHDVTELQVALLLLSPGPDEAPTWEDMGTLHAIMLRHLGLMTQELARHLDVAPEAVLERLAQVDEAEYNDPPDTL
jgi:hypothetical protein